MALKLTINGTSRLDPICAGQKGGVLKRIPEHCGTAAAELTAAIEEMSEVAFAYECQSVVVGDYTIDQEHRGGATWFGVKRYVVVTPAETIEVADEVEAMAICKARSTVNGNPFGVTKEQGGKRNRVDATGKLYTCGTAPGFGFSEDVTAKTVPVIAFFKSRVLFATLSEFPENKDRCVDDNRDDGDGDEDRPSFRM